MCGRREEHTSHEIEGADFGFACHIIEVPVPQSQKFGGLVRWRTVERYSVDKRDPRVITPLPSSKGLAMAAESSQDVGRADNLRQSGWDGFSTLRIRPTRR